MVIVQQLKQYRDNGHLSFKVGQKLLYIIDAIGWALEIYSYCLSIYMVLSAPGRQPYLSSRRIFLCNKYILQT